MKKKDIQNVYDNPTFFEEYKKLRQNNQGFNSLIEQPAIISLLPDLLHKSILDIGCGFGDFARFAIQSGAASILALDASENMINHAKNNMTDKNINFKCIAIENFSSEDKQFDLIVSSLAFHYIENFSILIEKIALWLKPNGYLIFSVEHPIATANPAGKLLKANKDQDVYPVYNYRDEKQISQTWFVEGVIKYHRTLSTYINTLIANGFLILSVLEPMPSDSLIEKRPDFLIHKIRPPLLMIKAQMKK